MRWVEKRHPQLTTATPAHSSFLFFFRFKHYHHHHRFHFNHVQEGKYRPENRQLFLKFIPCFLQVCLLLALAVCSAQAYYLGGGGHGGPSQLAVHTRQQVQYVDTPSYGYVQPTNVFVESQSPPINMIMRTVSSPVNVQHVHVPSPGSFRATSSQDEPHVRVHTVTRPIISELREIITPRRFITQQILPVQVSATVVQRFQRDQKNSNFSLFLQEQVQTIVARSVPQNNFGGGFVGGRSQQFF